MFAARLGTGRWVKAGYSIPFMGGRNSQVQWVPYSAPISLPLTRKPGQNTLQDIASRYTRIQGQNVLGSFLGAAHDRPRFLSYCSALPSSLPLPWALHTRQQVPSPQLHHPEHSEHCPPTHLGSGRPASCHAEQVIDHCSWS